MNRIVKAALILGLMLSPFGIADAQIAPTSADKLQIINPVAGTKLKPGETVKVSIAKAGKVAQYPVTVSLVRANPGPKDLPLQVIAVGTKASEISWKVPSTMKEGLYSITAMSHGVKISGKVDVEISIPKTIQLLTLNGGEKFKVGDTAQIKWKTNLPTKTQIYLELNDTRVPGDVVEANSPIPDYQVAIPNTGSYAWKIPATLGNGLMKLGGGNVYKLRIVATSSNDSFVGDYSDAMFSIVNPAGTGTTTATTTTPVGSPVLTVMPPTQPITSRVYTVDAVDGVRGVDLAGFSVKGEGATSTIDAVTVRVNRVGSSTLPANIGLKDKAGVLYATKAVLADGLITFDNNQIHILKDRTQDFTIVVDMPSDIAPATTTLSVDIVEVTTKYGKVEYKPSRPIVGNRMYFIPAPMMNGGVSTYTLARDPSITKTSNQKGDTVGVVATFPLTMTAMAGSVSKPKSSDFKVVFTNASSSVVGIANVTVIPNTTTFINGATASVTVVATLPMDKAYTGIYQAKLVDVRAPNGGLTDFVTTPIYVLLPVVQKATSYTEALSASVAGGFRTVFGSVLGIFGF